MRPLLVSLGVLAAAVGGSSVIKGALRVGFWGALAMAVTAGIGSIFGAVVRASDADCSDYAHCE